MRDRKRNISIVFISQSYFKVSKYLRLNATHYFTVKISNKREFQQIARNHSPDTEFKYFMNFHKDYTEESFSFLVSDATLPLVNLRRFSNNLL